MEELSPVEIIDRNDIKSFHKRGWGGEDLYITQEQLAEFLQGKVIAIDDGEYTHTIILKG